VACDVPRESIPSRSRGNGLRGPVKAGPTGVDMKSEGAVAVGRIDFRQEPGDVDTGNK